jgi:hypothetical protein
MYDAYDSFWVDAIYDNEAAAIAHKEAGRSGYSNSTPYKIEPGVMLSDFRGRNP